VLQGVVAGQRLDEVLQHLEVRLHLVLLGPPGDQARLLVDRCVDDMAHVRDTGECCLRGALVLQIHREMREGLVAEDLRLAPRYRDDVPAVVEEPVHDGGPDEPARSGDEDSVRHGATPRGHDGSAESPA
jgi:hypothetical protein